MESEKSCKRTNEKPKVHLKRLIKFNYFERLITKNVEKVKCVSRLPPLNKIYIFMYCGKIGVRIRRYAVVVKVNLSDVAVQVGRTKNQITKKN